MKAILSINGGGTRGVASARFLVELENRLKRPLSEVFDLVAGTSTGSILAALVATPKAITAQAALDFYYSSAPKIFTRGWFDWGLVGPKYKSKDLEREIKECVGDYACKDAATNLLIPTVDADEIEATFVKSWLPEWADFPLWAAASASSSAQTYFPAYECERDGKKKRWIDGGNAANSPVACAMFEASRLWPQEDLVVVSIGTGKQMNPKPLPNGGMAQWASLVFGTLSECQDDTATYFAKNWGDSAKSFFFDIKIQKFPAMDDASKQNLDGLVRLAEYEIATDPQKWEEVSVLLNQKSHA